MAEMESVFLELNNLVKEQQILIHSLAEKINKIESIGGGGGGTGNASIEDYQTGKNYKRNVLVVDPTNETVYRVLSEYTSVSVDVDRDAGYLKLVGFESQIVTFNHTPTQAEIDTLPEDSLVAIYSTTDNPFTPILAEDNFNG